MTIQQVIQNMYESKAITYDMYCFLTSEFSKHFDIWSDQID